MNTYKSKQQYADEMEQTAITFFKYVGMFLLGAVFVFAIGWIVQLLWNNIVTDIFDLKELTYWKAVGLLALAKILFGGIGGSSSSSSKSKDRSHRGLIASEIHEAMQTEFKDEYHRKFGELNQSSDDAFLEDPTTVKVENLDEDALYEKWWAEEGEKKFEAFLDKH